jgi:hypothetical protein
MRTHLHRLQCLVALTALAGSALAGVLPEDRADLMYHVYDGGGVQIDGPSLLVRKGFLEKVSVVGNFYMDMVSSASIDVVTTASPYDEQRTQWSLGVDALRGKTTYSLNYINSSENDYEANTAAFSLSQDMFGDLTTVTLGYSRGWDTVRRRGDPTFEQPLDRRSYSVGLSQIITKNLILGAAFETITDEGFLNNPYRSVRYLDPTSGTGYSFQAEVYPRTHTSNAIAVNGRYYLPFRAAVNGEYRFYSDTWGITAHTADLGYTQPWKKKWIFDASVRYYTQKNADFYSDLFPRADAQNFLGRDKELATFQSYGLGISASYEFPGGWPRFVQKGSLNVRVEHLWFDYKDFRDIRVPTAPGTEPLYSFEANVVQLFGSIWF